MNVPSPAVAPAPRPPHPGGSSPRRRALGLVAVLVALAAIAVGCGLPRDGAPRALAPERVPLGILHVTTTTLESSGGLGSPNADLYFLEDGHLVERRRPVADLRPSTVLRELMSGVGSTESGGLNTAIPTGTSVIEAVQDDQGVVTVTLSREIQNVSGLAQKNAYAQMVYTLTALPGVTGVLFNRESTDGSAVELASPPTDTANASGRPVVRSDYQSLQPTTSTLSTATTEIATTGR